MSAAPTPDAQVDGVAADRLRSIVERIERLEEERRTLAEDIRVFYAEAKSIDLEAAILRLTIASRRPCRAEVEERETLRELYRRALGM